MLQVEEQPGRVGEIAIVHQYAPSAKERTVLFQNDVEDRFKQWVAWADESGRWRASEVDEFLVKRNAFVSVKYWWSVADLSIAGTNQARDVADLESPLLTLAKRAAQPCESVEKKREDEIGLQTLGFRSLHVLANLLHLSRIEGVTGERVFVEKATQMGLVGGVVNRQLESRTNIRLVTVPNRIN
jgi:hypothetical protein